VVFQYGTDGVTFPNQVSATPGTITGDTDTLVSATLNNLVDGTNYYFRICATSAAGTTYSAVSSFIPYTNPSASLVAVTAQTTTSVNAFGTYNAQGTNAQVYFDYGTDPTMTVYNSVQASPAVVNGYTNTPVSAVLPNLTQGTPYYYQLLGLSLIHI